MSWQCIPDGNGEDKRTNGILIGLCLLGIVMFALFLSFMDINYFGSGV